MTDDELKAIEARVVDFGTCRLPIELIFNDRTTALLDFMAHARKDIPQLVAEVRRLRDILKQIDSLYNRDRVAQPMAHQIEKLFDAVDGDDV